MRLEIRKLLYDIQDAVARMDRFTAGKNYVDYESDEILQAALVRQFEIIGEAVSRLAKLDPTLVARITDYQRIIAFRNILIHGYSDIDIRVVWDLMAAKLSILLREVATALEDE